MQTIDKDTMEGLAAFLACIMDRLRKASARRIAEGDDQ